MCASNKGLKRINGNIQVGLVVAGRSNGCNNNEQMGVVAQAARKIRITHSESVVGELTRRENVDHIGCLLTRNNVKTIINVRLMCGP